MTSEAIPNAMSEKLTPGRAADLLNDAASFQDAIERRTEGITLALWGIVSSAIFVTYGFASVLDATEWVFAILWTPWVFLGILTTHALWRSVALARDRPMIDEPARNYWFRSLAIAFSITAIFVFIHPDGPLFPLGILGAAYLVLGALNLFRSGPRHRRMYLVAGAILLALAVGFGLAGAPIAITGTVSIVAPALVLCSLGLWSALRG